MKPLGIVSAATGTAMVVTGLVLHITPPVPITIFCAGLDALMLIAWIGWFTPDWVRAAADSYAERLLAACESL